MNGSKYEAELAELASHIHGRNARLVHLALLGLRKGRDEATLQNEIIAAGGEPRLSEKEVKRAINKAKQVFTANNSRGLSPVSRGLSPVSRGLSPGLRSPVNEKALGFVREMIKAGKGAKSGDFKQLSTLREEREGVVEFLKRIFKPGELVFAGTPYMPRTKENLKTVEELIAEVENAEGKVGGAVLPAYIVPNPFTGEPGKNSDGEVSYCLDSTIAYRRMALIEFDGLPLKEQAEFWMGLIKSRLLLVRSLVYSGNKSIHGLIELDETKPWADQWRILEQHLCSDADQAYRADRACKNASRFTRFPNAIRPDNGKRQTLLYLG